MVLTIGSNQWFNSLVLEETEPEEDYVEELSIYEFLMTPFKPGDTVELIRDCDSAKAGMRFVHIEQDIYQFEDQSGAIGWVYSKTNTFCYHLPYKYLRATKVNDGLDNWE